jgi:YVTN family beta-propeller protein
VWVANRGDGTVTRIDPATNATVTTRVGQMPVALAFAAGRVWVSNTAGASVTGIDPTTGATVAVPTGQAPLGLLALEDALAVTLSGESALARLDLRSDG